MIKRTALFLLGVAVASPVFAHQLVFTENSSAILSVTYDGSSTGIAISQAGLPDTWNVVLPLNVSTGLTTYEWREPEDGSLSNLVIFSSPGLIVFIVSEDSGNFPGAVPDEATIANVGFDTRDQQPISATFDDDGDRMSTVPDTSGTLGLLSLSFSAVCAVAWLRERKPVIR
jgi:hypothetical protein